MHWAGVPGSAVLRRPRRCLRLRSTAGQAALCAACCRRHPAHPPPRCPGEEAEEEDAEAAEAAAKLRIRSAHDALEDERLAKEPAVDIDLDRRARPLGPLLAWLLYDVAFWGAVAGWAA